MAQEKTYGESGYWYPNRASRGGVRLLNAMRRYRAAEAEMRQRTRSNMGMNGTDMEAVRFLLRAGKHGETVSPTGLATHLGITTASTTALVKRLVGSGHVARHADPNDRRGVLLTATASGDDRVRSELTDVHARMIAAADRLSPRTVEEMSAFFEEMIGAMHATDAPASASVAAAQAALPLGVHGS
jgi:DNA-binding MarR family transcriptional regulator